MTEREYYILLIGHKERELKESKIERRRLWLILNSYADPKKLPKSESIWMPLEGDFVRTEISREEILKANEAFLSIGKNKNK